MRFLILVIVFISSVFLFGEIANANITSQKDKDLVIRGYAVEILGKYGLLFCMSGNNDLDSDTKENISKNKNYFFQNMVHVTSTGEDDDFDIGIDVFIDFFKKTTEAKECVAIYSSPEYKELLHKYDEYMYIDDFNSNNLLDLIEFNFGDVVSYKSVEDSRKELSEWGFYKCLSNGIPEEQYFKDLLLKLEEKIEVSKDEHLGFIEILYEDVSRVYMAQGYPTLGCFIAYDSSFINTNINNIFIP